jgi:hypothetical protein
VLECLLGPTASISCFYYDCHTCDLTPRLEALKSYHAPLYEAVVAALIEERERLEAAGDALSAGQIYAYMERRPYPVKQPPYVIRTSRVPQITLTTDSGCARFPESRRSAEQQSGRLMHLQRRKDLEHILCGYGTLYYGDLYRDPQGRYLWHNWSVPIFEGNGWHKPQGWVGYRDLPMELAYVVRQEADYTNKMFEREFLEEDLRHDRRWTKMYVVTPEYLGQAVLECLLAGDRLDIAKIYNDDHTFDLTPRMELLQNSFPDLYEAAAAELLGEKERVVGRGDARGAQQIELYLARQPFPDTQPPYVLRDYAER